MIWEAPAKLGFPRHTIYELSQRKAGEYSVLCLVVLVVALPPLSSTMPLRASSTQPRQSLSLHTPELSAVPIFHWKKRVKLLVDL